MGGQVVELGVKIGDQFAATDSLACESDAGEDANECLAELFWTPGDFAVRVHAAEPGHGDWLVRFPSPRPIGDETNDLASMEWYAARDDK